MENYHDVCAQLASAGLLEDAPVVDGRIHRVRTQDSGRERAGWYVLHEWRTNAGAVLCVGAFGVWQGADKTSYKVELHGIKASMSEEERRQLGALAAEARRKAAAAEKAAAEKAADTARKMFARLSHDEPDGGQEYLRRKGVKAFGVRFSPKSGAMAVPMCDAQGRICGLQVIRPRPLPQGKMEKEYWPRGMKKRGLFHTLGHVSRADGAMILVAEGYATAASLHAATQLPVVVAFDAGNLAPVAQALRQKFRGANIMLCADDDAGQKCRKCNGRVWIPDGVTCPHCGEAHEAKNAGIDCALNAAQLAGSGDGKAAIFAPHFTDEAERRAGWIEHGSKVTDFNDLHVAEGQELVYAQFDARAQALGWHASAAGGGGATSSGAQGGGEGALRASVSSVDEMIERFVLIDGQTMLFDTADRRRKSDRAVRLLCAGRHIFRDWQERDDKKICAPSAVGFDPTEKDPAIIYNEWEGWPVQPRAGKCCKLLELLHFLCRDEAKNSGYTAGELYKWVLKWLAYPLQHPGAKMKTSLVVRGAQGTGKSLFFEAVMRIYGQYGIVINQDAQDDKFNDWASRKMLIIADEVVAHKELYASKNRLKGYITGDWIRINPKGEPARLERNYVNWVYLSNETQPVLLEHDDRRHVVISVPSEKLPREFYKEVLAEIRGDGIAALFEALLHVDLTDFDEGAEAIMTESKREVVRLGAKGAALFYQAWESGEIDGFPGRNTPALLSPVLSSDFYKLYCEWSRRNGLKVSSSVRFVSDIKGVFNVRSVQCGYAAEISAVEYKRKVGRFIFCYGGEEQPVSIGKEEWLGRMVGRFRVALNEYLSVYRDRSEK